MRIKAKVGFFGTMLVFSLAGCAGGGQQHLVTIKALEDQLAHSREEVAALDVEKRELEKEVDLYCKAQNVDRDQLLAARDAFREAFTNEIAGQSIWVGLTARGLDVTVSAEKLFVSGSDVLSPEGKALLDRAAPLIDAALPGYYIYIEGHTDNQPLAVFEWKSDWDFSFARALSVLKYFTEVRKMDPLRFSAAGFGQYRPRATNDTKEGRSLNRRIELVISPQREEESFSPPPASGAAEPAKAPAAEQTPAPAAEPAAAPATHE
ncbi:MAG: OmpA family protein [Deltaproteobacteria bacterium]